MSDLGNSAVRPGEVGLVCKYNQTGFCKFRDRCRSKHISQICGNQNKCKEDQCNERHPKICRNFNNTGKCRHNNNCAYQHIVQNNKYDEEDDIKILTSKVEHLEKII